MLGHDRVSQVPQYKYLGLILDEFMSFDDAIQVLANSACRALRGMIAKFRDMSDMGFATYTKLFFSCVTPVMDYRAGVWGNRN